MNQNFLLGLLCLFLGTTAVFANDFERANEQFKAGDFSGAAAAYEKILAAEGPRAAVFYNLGNSYQQLKRHGPAILAYERARLLTPRDPDLLANLALARKAATVAEVPGPYPRLDVALNYLSPNEWSWLVAGSALFLGCLAVVCGAVKLPRRWVVGPACLAGVCIIAGATALYLQRVETGRGVVLSADAAVRLSPFEKAESLGTPGAGRIVRLGAGSGDFQYIEVPGASLSGWMAGGDVAAIAPEALR
jgi:tetratricopeptide (TPR) repeat protein